jgi:hypothetical protein
MSDRSLEGIDFEAALRALVVLAAADRAERDPPPRISTDRLLFEVGLTHTQIGAIVGDRADTVRKRLERAGKEASAPKKGSKR